MTEIEYANQGRERDRLIREMTVSFLGKVTQDRIDRMLRNLEDRTAGRSPVAIEDCLTLMEAVGLLRQVVEVTKPVQPVALAPRIPTEPGTLVLEFYPEQEIPYANCSRRVIPRGESDGPT